MQPLQLARQLAKQLARQLITTALLALCTLAHADTYPSRPIKLVVTFGPGSGPDTLAREMAPRMSEVLGQQVVVENRPGGGGNVAAQAVLSDPRDGYTLLMGTDSLFTLNPLLFPKTSFDAMHDLTVVTPVAEVALFLVANASLKVDTVGQLVSLVKSQPGQMNYSAPSGTPHHLAGERFTWMNQLDWVRVSYRDTQQAVNDLLGGRVPVAFSTWPSVRAHVASGRLKALAVTTSGRLDFLPEVPAMNESLPGFEESGWFAIVVGTGTPPAVIAKINAAVLKARGSPELKLRLEQQGMRLITDDARRFDARIRAESQRRGELVRTRNIKID